MRRPLAWVGAIVATAVAPTIFLPLQGCDSEPAAAAGPADAALEDAQPDAATEAAPPLDASWAPAGVRVFATPKGQYTELVGITGDGFVVFHAGTHSGSSSSRTLYAVPLTGGPAQVISELTDSFATVQIRDNVVLAWPLSGLGTDDGSEDGPLKVWTAEQGTATLAMRSPSGSAMRFGNRLVFWKGHGNTSETNDIVVSDLDGSNATTLLSDEPRCGHYWPANRTATVVGGAILVGLCVGVGSDKAITLASFDTANGYARSDLDTRVFSWDVTANQETAIALSGSFEDFYYDLGGTLRAMPLGKAGGAPVVVDSYDVRRAAIAKNDVVWVTPGGVLKRSPTMSAAPTVVASGLRDIQKLDVSPDGLRVFTTAWSDGSAAFKSFGLASLAAPVGFVRLDGSFYPPHPAGTTPSWSTETTHPFTQDSTHALLQTNPGVELVAFAAANGSPKRVAENGFHYAPLDGGRVIFSDGSGIKVADLGVAPGSAPARQIVEGCRNFSCASPYLDFVMSPTKDQVVYDWVVADPARAGLYVTKIP